MRFFLYTGLLIGIFLSISVATISTSRTDSEQPIYLATMSEAVQTRHGMFQHIYLIDFETGFRRSVARFNFNGINRPFARWSPDQRWLWVTLYDRVAGRNETHRINLASETASPIGLYTANSMLWSPNGEWGLYTEENNGVVHLYRLNGGGGEPVLLDDNWEIWDRSPGGFKDVEWSSDGRTVFITGTSSTYAAPLYRIDQYAYAPQLLFRRTEVNSREATVSPDDSRIALLTFDGFYVLNTDGTDIQQLPTSQSQSYNYLAWTSTQAILAIDFSNDDFRQISLVAIDSSTGIVRKISDFFLAINRPLWSPDGSKLLIVHKDADDTNLSNATFYVFGRDGELEWQATVSDRCYNEVQWTADSRSILYTAHYSSTTCAVMKYDIGHSEAHLIYELPFDPPIDPLQYFYETAYPNYFIWHPYSPETHHLVDARTHTSTKLNGLIQDWFVLPYYPFRPISNLVLSVSLFVTTLLGLHWNTRREKMV